MCFDNFTIVPLYMPDNPSKPCLSCTRQFCLDQKLPICRGQSHLKAVPNRRKNRVRESLEPELMSLFPLGSGILGAEVPDLDTDTGTGKEGDVEARCFSRSTLSSCGMRGKWN